MLVRDSAAMWLAHMRPARRNRSSHPRPKRRGTRWRSAIDRRSRNRAPVSTRARPRPHATASPRAGNAECGTTPSETGPPVREKSAKSAARSTRALRDIAHRSPDGARANCPQCIIAPRNDASAAGCTMRERKSLPTETARNNAAAPAGAGQLPQPIAQGPRTRSPHVFEIDAAVAEQIGPVATRTPETRPAQKRCRSGRPCRTYPRSRKSIAHRSPPTPGERSLRLAFRAVEQVIPRQVDNHLRVAGGQNALPAVMWPAARGRTRASARSGSGAAPGMCSQVKQGDLSARYSRSRNSAWKRLIGSIGWRTSLVSLTWTSDLCPARRLPELACQINGCLHL